MQANEHPIRGRVFTLLRHLKSSPAAPIPANSASRESSSMSGNGTQYGDSYGPAAPLDCGQARAVLHEVYELLEAYGPSWYSEELRERIQSALNPGNEKS